MEEQLVNTESDELKKRIEIAIEKIRGPIQSDGGDVELIDVDMTSKKVFLRFIGACSHCSMLDITLKQGVEATLKNEIPEISEVVSV